MVLNEANDMESVADDLGIWKPFPDDPPVGATQVDTDHFNALSALEGGKEREQFLLTLSLHDIEDLMVSKVAEGRGQSLLFVEGMLVDP